MTAALNIEQPDELLHYLRETGRVPPDQTPVITRLPGGVSNRTVLVEPPNAAAFVLKQALAKLRVATDWYSHPDRIHREALGLRWLVQLAPPGTTTPLVFEDKTHHLLAMQAVPRPHENWKSQLLAGRVEAAHVKQFGQILGTIHRRARERREEIAPVFDDRTFFDSLRLEPYYRFTATLRPEAAGFYADLIAETTASRLTLVHGDYSPKNVLVSQDTLVLLDHEVIHFGDPAFDLGFSLTHFLSKAHHLPARRQTFWSAARLFWEAYRQTAGELALSHGFEARVVRHTVACLLARVDGRSPLEYLGETEKNRQRTAVLSLLGNLPTIVPELIERFGWFLRD